MSLPRFLHPGPLAPDNTVELPEALAHHAVRVLRLKADAPIVLFDGSGGQYAARLMVDGKKAWAALGAHDPAEAELAGRITLVQGIASGDKMDWIIEKAVELGVSDIVPIFAQRSVLQLSGERLAKRLEHWRRVVNAATTQCGRNRLTTVHAPCALRDYLTQQQPEAASTLFCHPGGALSLAQALEGVHEHLTLLVGPEGGWSDEELALASAAALTPVSFGRSVLRTETAGLALVAASAALLGWA